MAPRSPSDPDLPSMIELLTWLRIRRRKVPFSAWIPQSGPAVDLGSTRKVIYRQLPDGQIRNERWRDGELIEAEISHSSEIDLVRDLLPEDWPPPRRTWRSWLSR